MAREKLRPIDVIRMAMPDGTLSYKTISEYELAENELAPWQCIPDWPPDLFGICAYLLEQSGAYHHLTPGGQSICRDNFDFCMTPDVREMVCVEANKWKASPTHEMPWAQEEWEKLISNDRPISAQRQNSEREPLLEGNELPDWWEAAIILTSLSDQCCKFLGHSGNHGDGVSPWMSPLLITANLYDIPDASQNATWSIPEGNRSICMQVSSDLICVQPKSKTPAIGLTIRSISQNLSLLPGAGVIQAGWQYSPMGSMGEPQESEFHCLFVPYPYHFGNDSFEIDGASNRWRWFSIKQNWIWSGESEIKKFVQFICALVEKSAQKGKLINGIVLPEYSINWEIHRALVNHIAKLADPDENSAETSKIFDRIEFVITGASDNCDGEIGNFILTTQIIDEYSTDPTKTKIITSTSRAKHHRWQMTKGQIASYGMTSGFEEKSNKNEIRSAYWEKITIPRRKFHAHTFRDRSIFTTLICEDLARAEPVHKYVRAIGPNIIFVLLMDGPQLQERWSARYSMGLAEDPGSTVLTLTSRALVKKSNDQRKLAESKPQLSWSIGLSRNPFHSPQVLECPRNCEAVVVSFQATNSDELTIDGRRNSTGWNWSVTKDKEDPVTTLSLDRSCPNEREYLDLFVVDYSSTNLENLKYNSKMLLKKFSN